MFVGFAFALFSVYVLLFPSKQKPKYVEVYGCKVPTQKVIRVKNHKGHLTTMGLRFRGGIKLRSSFWNRHKQEIPMLAISVCAGVALGHILETMVIAIPLVNRTWGGGSLFTGNNWSTLTNWTGDTVPQAGDDVILNATQTAYCLANVAYPALNSLSVSATASLRLGINQTNTAGTVALNAGAINTMASYSFIAGDVSMTNASTISFNASTVTMTSFTSASGSNGFQCIGNANITMNGNWNTTDPTPWLYQYGTSTVTFAANANVSGYHPVLGDLYNVVVNTGVTVTFTTDFRAFNNLTLNGTAKVVSNPVTVSFTWSEETTNANPLTLSGSEDMTGLWLSWVNKVNSNIPAMNVGAITFGAAYSINHTLAGDIVMQGLSGVSVGVWADPGNLLTLTTAGYDITVGSTMTDFFVGELFTGLEYPGVLICTGGSVITINCPLKFAKAGASPNSYVTCDNSGVVWNCAGDVTNLMTNASWNPGNSTFNFNGTLAQTLGLNDGNSANIKYYNITISNSGVVNVTMGANAIDIDGLLNCTTTTATIKLNTNNPTLYLAGGLTLANGCGWTKGSNPVYINGASTITDNNATKRDLGAIIISGAIAVVFAGARWSTLTNDDAGATPTITQNCECTTGGYIDLIAGTVLDGTAGKSITSVA